MLEQLPEDLQEQFLALKRRAHLPFTPPLDHLVRDFLPLLIKVKALGASMVVIADLLSELGVKNRNGKPVVTATLSKSMCRALINAQSRQVDASAGTERQFPADGGAARQIAAADGNSRQIWADRGEPSSHIKMLTRGRLETPPTSAPPSASPATTNEAAERLKESLSLGRKLARLNKE